MNNTQSKESKRNHIQMVKCNLVATSSKRASKKERVGNFSFVKKKTLF